MTQPLSPAAQAVKDAVLALYSDEKVHRFGWQLDAPTVAAALRALADQLHMKEPLGETDADAGVQAAHHAIHAQILDIAAELEGGND